MAIRNLTDLGRILAPGRRLMGLDVGEKTIGVAVSDPALRLAAPVDTVRRTRFTADVGALARMVGGRQVGGFVVGLPVNMDGTEGPRCQSVRHFAQNLLGRGDLLGFEPEIAFWDERLSTVAVERSLIADIDMSRAKRAAVIDQMAASYILQGALDALAHARTRAADPVSPHSEDHR